MSLCVIVAGLCDYAEPGESPGRVEDGAGQQVVHPGDELRSLGGATVLGWPPHASSQVYAENFLQGSYMFKTSVVSILTIR